MTKKRNSRKNSMICTPDGAPVKSLFFFFIYHHNVSKQKALPHTFYFLSFMCMELPSKIPSVHQITTCDIPLPYFPQTPTVAQWHQPNLNPPRVIRVRKACSVEQLNTVKKRKYISSSCENDSLQFLQNDI